MGNSKSKGSQGPNSNYTLTKRHETEQESPELDKESLHYGSPDSIGDSIYYQEEVTVKRQKVKVRKVKLNRRKVKMRKMHTELEEEKEKIYCSN